MRDLALMLTTLGCLGATFRYPFVGMLLWIWFSIENPHQETYSFAHHTPWNLIIAIVTTVSWLVSSERKMPPKGITTGLVLALLAWTTFNTFFAFDPSWSWIYWNRAWKTIVMCILAGTLAVNAVRFQALAWVVALSLCYFGVKGGLFTLISGGHSRVLGPEDTIIFDNNTLAVAFVMVLPILNYLRQFSGSRFVRMGITGAIVLVVASVLGSYSRGGYISLAILGAFFWTRAKNKFVYPVVAAIVLVPLLKFMPESFYERVSTIQQYSTDASFQDRLDSWYIGYRYAMDHIPFGAGFYGMNLQGVWDLYIPGEMHAIHSIYFQVLGEQGVPGLILYLSIIAVAFLNFRATRRNTKNVPELAWAHELAGMMQLSLLVFCVGGSAVPIDFFDLFFLWTLLSAALRELTGKKAAEQNVSVFPARQLLPEHQFARAPPR
jgi:probable O-glycosylation ligase (exosortase A-associated)